MAGSGWVSAIWSNTQRNSFGDAWPEGLTLNRHPVLSYHFSESGCVSHVTSGGLIEGSTWTWSTEGALRFPARSTATAWIHQAPRSRLIVAVPASMGRRASASGWAVRLGPTSTSARPDASSAASTAMATWVSAYQTSAFGCVGVTSRGDATVVSAMTSTVTGAERLPTASSVTTPTSHFPSSGRRVAIPGLTARVQPAGSPSGSPPRTSAHRKPLSPEASAGASQATSSWRPGYHRPASGCEVERSPRGGSASASSRTVSRAGSTVS